MVAHSLAIKMCELSQVEWITKSVSGHWPERPSQNAESDDRHFLQGIAERFKTFQLQARPYNGSSFAMSRFSQGRRRT